MPLFLRLCRGGRTSENSSISAARHTAFLSPGRAIPADCSDKEKSYFSTKISRNLRSGKESAVFLSKTHILFEKKEKQLCKAQKILT